ncbi:MAG: GUN4 domain-containing protein, partial [Dolichospermum sp.]
MANLEHYRQCIQTILKEHGKYKPKYDEIDEEGGLKSSCGMDYSKLRDLLKAGKWKEADEETRVIMLCVGEREREGWLNAESIDNFPCADLRTIDKLWVKYSDGR